MVGRTQLTQPQRVRALSLLEAGWSQAQVAKRVQCSRWTIGRLQKLNVTDPSQVRKRKSGTGLKNKSYGSKEKRAIHQVIDKHPYLTSFQVKMRLRKTLQHLSARTIRRIMVKDLGRPAGVAARKPFLTDQMKIDRVGWCKSKLRKPRRSWNQILFVDEVMFSTKADTGGRLVRRPRGASRTDPKYTRKGWHQPAKVMALCGFSSGTRFIHFLRPGERMNSKKYTSVLSKHALEPMRTNSLTILQDRSRVHTSKHSQQFLKEQKVKSILLPARSPDINPIENLFGYLKQLLQQRPTRTLQQLRNEVRRAWRNLSEDLLQQLATSMPRRMREVIKLSGEMSDY